MSNHSASLEQKSHNGGCCCRLLHFVRSLCSSVSSWVEFHGHLTYLLTCLLTSGLRFNSYRLERHRAVTAIVANHICFQFFFLHFSKIDPLSYCCFSERAECFLLFTYLLLTLKLKISFFGFSWS